MYGGKLQGVKVILYLYFLCFSDLIVKAGWKNVRLFVKTIINVIDRIREFLCFVHVMNIVL